MKGQRRSVYGGAKLLGVWTSKPLGLWRGKATRSTEGQSHLAHGGTLSLHGLWVDRVACHKATRPMEGQSRSVYGGAKPLSIWRGKAARCMEEQATWLWRGKAARFMEGQSHLAYGGTKPLGPWRGTTTRLIEGQSRSAYGGARPLSFNVIVCICVFYQ